MTENIGLNSENEHRDDSLTETELNESVSKIMRVLNKEYGVNDLTNHEYLRLYSYTKQFMNDALQFILKTSKNSEESRSLMVFNALYQASDNILYAWFNDICGIDYADFNKLRKRGEVSRKDLTIEEYINLLRTRNKDEVLHDMPESIHDQNDIK